MNDTPVGSFEEHPDRNKVHRQKELEDQFDKMRGIYATVGVARQFELIGFMVDPETSIGQHERLPVIELGFVGQVMAADGAPEWDDDLTPKSAMARIFIPAFAAKDLTKQVQAVYDQHSQGDGVLPIELPIDPTAEVLGQSRRVEPKEEPDAEGTEE